MSETCNRLKTNLKLQGQPCAACKVALALGEDAAQCMQCNATHHATCWDGAGGCATPVCVNAPLKRLDDQPVPQVPRAGHKQCPACNSEINVMEEICPYCNSITTADGLYHGPKVNAPGAVASLVWGLLGLLICGVIFGAVAISKSSAAKKAIAADPRYGGAGLATAGMVIGIIDIVAWALILLARAGGS